MADVGRLGKSLTAHRAGLRALAKPGNFDRSGLRDDVKCRLDGGIDPCGAFDLGEASASVELVGSHVGPWAERTSVAGIVGGGVVVRIGGVNAGGAELEAKIHTRIHKLGIGCDDARPDGDTSTTILPTAVAPDVGVCDLCVAIARDADISVADDDIITNSDYAGGIIHIDATAKSGGIAIDGIVLYIRTPTLKADATSVSCGVDVYNIVLDGRTTCVNTDAAAAIRLVVMDDVLLYYHAAIVDVYSPAVGVTRCGVAVDFVAPDRGCTSGVYPAATIGIADRGNVIVIDQVVLNINIGSNIDTSAPFGRIGVDPVALNSAAAAARNIDAAAIAIVAKRCVAADMVALDGDIITSDVDAATYPRCVSVDPVALDSTTTIIVDVDAAACLVVRFPHRVAVNGVVLYRWAAGVVVDAASFIALVIVNDVVLYDRTATIVVNATSALRSLVLFSVHTYGISPHDAQVFYDGGTSAVGNVDHTALPLSVQSGRVRVWVGSGPIGGGVAAAEGKGFANEYSLGEDYAANCATLYTATNPGYLEQVARAGRIHRRLDGGVDLSGPDAGKAVASVELVRADVGLTSKRSRQSPVIHLCHLCGGHLIFARRTGLDADV